MAGKYPKKLKADTIVEALFELRFKGINDSLSHILPGIFYTHLQGRHPQVKNVSGLVRKSAVIDQETEYRSTPILESEAFGIALGNKVITLSNKQPYTGWVNFKSEIINCLKILKDSGLVESFERFSLRYINMIPAVEKLYPGVKLLSKLGDTDLTSNPFKIQTEIQKGDFIHILIMGGRAAAVVKRGAEEIKIEGFLFDIDVIYNKPLSKNWDELENLLEVAHDNEKSIYFENLTKEMLNHLGPVWE